MLSFYQHLPQNISPIAISVGLFELRWYSLMYLVGLGVVYLLIGYRITKREDRLNSNFIQMSNQNLLRNVSDWIMYSVAGLLIGGRLGYVLFYNFNYYFHNPIAIISPYDFSSGAWTGIFGMSYFGGVLGVILSGWIWARLSKIDFWVWADFVVPAIPAGYFFGRIGNFLNGELYGRTTDKVWGMYFLADSGAVLRHPSQIYEALFEGLILFLILWLGRNKIKFSGQPLAVYLLFYGLFRFGIEFFRAPDNGADLFFNVLTLGQIFSLGFMALALILGGALSKREKAL